ncbi:MAG TPA: hypothetical protein VFV19_11745 [Candidatus Polarisedimenticolaceae bacterium]|nr:hypothetical protein [Candidatus Polarisedimenticolaceae bacterium]
MIWWQRVLNRMYGERVYMQDGTRIIYFPRESLLRYIVPDRPSQFMTRRPKAAVWIPLSYSPESKQLHVLIDAVKEWEIPAGQEVSQSELDDLRSKLKIYVGSASNRFAMT